MSKALEKKGKSPKKSKRARRRYILFEIEAGGRQLNPKDVFNAVVGSFKRLFGEAAPKKHLLWFIEFMPASSRGIVRCRKESVEKARQAIESIERVGGVHAKARALKTSGTLKKLRSSQAS